MEDREIGEKEEEKIRMGIECTYTIYELRSYLTQITSLPVYVLLTDALSRASITARDPLLVKLAPRRIAITH